MTVTQKSYPQVEPSPDFPAIEQEILAFWKKQDVFPLL